ncbi:uncharacterized protein LOC122498110 [Leptopilina heterotoma]|uniref:uncharacterized protein LOC122498110 n=1 Tax=Leptopilina heterotoma TaxID=63436 RepID=UPI001CA97318|nr:uncharacterized protein LOC122498110 [Leptopilina heterotoma]
MKISDFRDENGQDDNVDFDVIIVGAGLTGLTAAYNLLKKEVGLDVLILEATEKIGGRIFITEESKSFHAHPLQKNLMEMLDELNISTVSQRQIPTANERIFLTKSGPRQKLPVYILAQVYNFLATIQSISLDFQQNMNVDEANILSQINLDQLTDSFLSWGTAKSITQSLLITSCGKYK